MNNENAPKTEKFNIWFYRVLLVCMAVSIACNFIQLAGGFPEGMWQFGFIPVVVCFLVSELRTLIKEQRPNLTPIKIRRQKMTKLEALIRLIFFAVWAVSVLIVVIV